MQTAPISFSPKMMRLLMLNHIAGLGTIWKYQQRNSHGAAAALSSSPTFSKGLLK